VKIVSLNIQHGGGKRVERIVGYLDHQSADVIVLTEFRENANARSLRSALATLGYQHFAAASIDPRMNSVCIFSKQPFIPCTYPKLTKSDRSRIVSVQFEKLTVLGVYFSQNKAKSSLFNFLLERGCDPLESEHMFLGDFNTGIPGLDEKGKTFQCADQFAALSTSGLIDSWRSRNAEKREFSWFSNAGNGFRIDHAFSSPEADGQIQEVYYDHEPRKQGVTDHSALIVEYLVPRQ